MSGPPKTGYKSPPVHSRFQKGTSGNPRGRPKRPKPFIADLLAELSERVELTDGGRRKRLTKQQIVIKQLISAAARGDVRAAALIVRLRDGAPPDPLGTIETALPPNDQKLLDAYVSKALSRRAKGGKS